MDDGSWSACNDPLNTLEDSNIQRLHIFFRIEISVASFYFLFGSMEVTTQTQHKHNNMPTTCQQDRGFPKEGLMCMCAQLFPVAAAVVGAGQ